jgi:hypothetical protein
VDVDSLLQRRFKNSLDGRTSVFDTLFITNSLRKDYVALEKFSNKKFYLILMSLKHASKAVGKSCFQNIIFEYILRNCFTFSECQIKDLFFSFKMTFELLQLLQISKK